MEIYFSNGQNRKVSQPLLLEPGEVQALSNADLSSFGAVKVAATFAVSNSLTGTIHSILSESSGKRYICEGNNIWEDSAGTLTLVSSSLDGSYVSGIDNNGWMYLCTLDGLKKKFLITDRSGWSEWGIDPPDTAASTGSSDEDEFACYYTYVAKYDDGSEYETALSPASYTTHILQTGTATGGSTTTLEDSTAPFGSDLSTGMRVVIKSAATSEEYTVYLESATTTELTFSESVYYGYYTVVSGDTYTIYGKTSWSGIVASSNTDVNYKRLYRTNLAGDSKFLVEIANATTTYTDLFSEDFLDSANTFDRVGYYPPPDNMWMVVEHYRRIFALTSDDSYKHCLFYSEEDEPQAFTYDEDTGLYANYTDVFRKGEAVTGIASFGGDLFLSSKRMWKRLVGATPSYWALRPTLSNIGNLARYALVNTRYGILHVWYDGVYLFNGYNSNRISGKNEPFFQNVNWDYADTIRATFDGKVYRLLVPYDDSTTPNRAFCLDMEAYPRIKAYEENQGEQIALFDANTNITYYGKSGQYGIRNGNETVAFELWSKSIPTAALIQLDGASQLNYEIDTGGEDVTLTIYHDNAAHDTTITINNESRSRDWVSLPLKNARTISIKLSGNLTSGVTIYEPWIIGGNQ